MKIEAKKIAELEARLVAAEKILLVCHASPDGDALGSMLALFLALNRLGKDVTPLCKDPIPDTFAYLPGGERLVNEIADPTAYDLVISLDSGDLRQTKLDTVYPELFDGSRFLIKIDHHAFASDFGDLRFVYTESAASCCILTQIFEQLNIRIRPDMATCLMTGIVTDTGSFHHDNTTPEVYRTAAKLLRSGANLPKIRHQIYGQTALPVMRLWGRILKTLKQTEEGVTVAVAKQSDFDETGSSYEDLAGIVDWVNAVPNAKFSILLSERGDIVKASLRTLRDDVNVAKIAAGFGGGGHVKAAGFAVPGSLAEETRWKIIPPANAGK